MTSQRTNRKHCLLAQAPDESSLTIVSDKTPLIDINIIKRCNCAAYDRIASSYVANAHQLNKTTIANDTIHLSLSVAVAPFND